MRVKTEIPIKSCVSKKILYYIILLKISLLSIPSETENYAELNISGEILIKLWYKIFLYYYK